MRRNDEDVVIPRREIGRFSVLAMGCVWFLAVRRRRRRRAIHGGWNVEEAEEEFEVSG